MTFLWKDINNSSIIQIKNEFSGVPTLLEQTLDIRGPVGAPFRVSLPLPGTYEVSDLQRSI